MTAVCLPGKPHRVTQTVRQRRLSLFIALLWQFCEQHAERLHQRREEAAHQSLLALGRTLSVHDQHAGRLKHEQLIVIAQQRWKPVLLERQRQTADEADV